MVCRKVFAYEIEDIADTDAPILYNLNDTRQDAAVYRKKIEKQSSYTRTEIISSFILNGEKRDAFLTLQTVNKGDHIRLIIEAPQYITVGISSISDKISSSNLNAITDQFAKYGVKSTVERLGDYSEDAAKQFSTESNEQYLIISGIAGEITVEIPGQSSHTEQSVTVILFDNGGRPIIKSAVDILLPS